MYPGGGPGTSRVVTFISPCWVSITLRFAHEVDSLVRVSRRVVEDHLPGAKAGVSSRTSLQVARPNYRSTWHPSGESYARFHYVKTSNSWLVHTYKSALRCEASRPPEARRIQTRRPCRESQFGLTCLVCTRRPMGLIPLALNDFRAFFTLFPKCFSSFVHTTCSLSVLVQYLAFAARHQRFAQHYQTARLLESAGIGGITRTDVTGRSPSSVALSRALHLTVTHIPLALALQFHGFRFLPPRIQA